MSFWEIVLWGKPPYHRWLTVHVRTPLETEVCRVKVVASTADYPVGGAFINEIASFFAESKKDEASPSSLLLTIYCESKFTVFLSNLILVTCFMNK